MKVVVTGGAGLIGSHIVDLLLAKGYGVKILDNLELPTHKNGKPPYIPEDAEFIHGDISKGSDVEKALEDVDIIFHVAATGGFKAEVSKYVRVNSLGTAKILDTILKKDYSIKKIVVTSSLAVYGEGKYECEQHGIIYPESRPISQLLKSQWEVTCPLCKSVLKALPTDENTLLRPATAYAITKYDQERLCMNFGKEYGIPVTVLRYFVTYGPRQSLYNPYTGVCSIFSTLILNSKSPLIYEDGMQTRDFVFVKDVADASVLAMEQGATDFEVFNVGSGRPITILKVVYTLIEKFNANIKPSMSGYFRPCEVRHIFADISKIRKIGYEPQYNFEEGINEQIRWIKSQGDVKEYFTEVRKSLEKKGVLRPVGSGKVEGFARARA